MCKFTKQIALAAAHAAVIASRNHPVYISEVIKVTKAGPVKTTKSTYRVGWTPADTREFSGSIRSL